MLTKEQRDEILRLAAEVIKKPSDTWESFGRLQNFTKYLDSITVPEGWKVGNELAPFHPSASHVEPGYRDGLNDCYRAMLAAAPKPGDSNEWMAELAARLRAMTTATMLDEYDMKAAADLIESMAKRVPLSDDPTPEFAKWVRDNLPAGTVIGDPDWWVPRLWRAVRNSSTDRPPLSNEEIWALWQSPADLSWKESVIRLAHAVEQVHGIKGARND